MAFYGPKESEFGLLMELFDRYRYVSSRFTYELVDPVVRQDLVERHKIHQGGPRILVRHRDREERVKLGEKEQSGPEEAITAALLKVTATGEKRKVCFITGHGEKALEGDDPRSVMTLFAGDLESEGYQKDTISLLEQPEVPPACQLVVLAGPSRNLIEDEQKSLENFLLAGGRMLVFLGNEDTTSLHGLLRKLGIVVGDDTVISPRGRSPLEVVTDPRRYPKTHPIFARFFSGSMVVLNQLQAVFPLSRSVRKLVAPPGHLEVTELVTSMSQAWGESDKIEGSGQIEVTFDRGKDTPGPVPMATVVQPKAKEPAEEPQGPRLAVFGSSHVAVDAAYRIFPFNRNLIMNTVAWLTHEEKKITIRPRYRAASLLRLRESDIEFITFFSMDILPLLILAFGITIWQIRRWS
jgi:hypothetical protein